jgi:hypothetical protein
MVLTSAFFGGACILVRTSWESVSGTWRRTASPPASRMPFSSASACGIIVSKLMRTSVVGYRVIPPPGAQHTNCLMWPYIE